MHVVDAELPGRAIVRAEARVMADSVMSLRLSFMEPVLSLIVSTTPDGAEILSRSYFIMTGRPVIRAKRTAQRSSGVVSALHPEPAARRPA